MRAALANDPDLLARRLGDRWLLALCTCLFGYALIGKGFAYLGAPPLFIGEVILVIGLFTLLVTRGWTRAFQVTPTVFIIPMAVWGMLRMVPYLGYYQIDAVRDAVVWGYAVFAVIVATLIIARPERLVVLFERYRGFARLFLLFIPVVFLIYRFAGEVIPTWPGSGVRMILVKEGDVLVHLSGILAFWMADPKRNVRWFWAVLLTLNMAMMGVIDRAGVVTFAAVMMICMVAKPFHGAAWRTVAMLICGVVLLWASAVKIEVPGGKGRDISWEQFVINTKSVFGHSQDHGLDSNKEWRINWWNKIIDYTVHGEYFWTGKGFGINLADDDGFQVNQDSSLRTPHNVHMTILARTGVPGVVLWALMHGAWLLCVLDAHLRARRRGQARWAGLFLFLLSYDLAFLINGSFDVFIEGPVGGIWYWTIFGTGIGALWAWRNRPDVMADDEDDSGYAVSDEDPRRAQLLPAAGRRRPGLPLGAGASPFARA